MLVSLLGLELLYVQAVARRQLVGVPTSTSLNGLELSCAHSPPTHPVPAPRGGGGGGGFPL